MALKPDRVVLEYDITLTCNDAAEEGLTLCFSTTAAGSGVAIGDSAGTAVLSTSQSGAVPAGMLLAPIVSLDTSLYDVNRHKYQFTTGSKCVLARKGWLVTNKVLGTPAVGGIAYLFATGWLSANKGLGGVVDSPPVGTFAGSKDADGYTKVNIDLPQVRFT